MYAYTDLGLAESRDFGEHWTPTMPNLVNPAIAYPTDIALLIDPDHPDTLYALGKQLTLWAGVIRSRDRGRSWEKMARLTVQRLIAVKDGNKTVLYSWSDELGLAKSIDGGASFSPVEIPEGRYELSSLLVAPSDNRRMYLSHRRGQDVFVAKINADATAIEWTSWLGTFGWEDATALAADCSGAIRMAGSTGSIDLFNDGPAVGESDAFVAAVSPDGSELRSLWRVSGMSWEVPGTLASGCDGSVLLSAVTLSRDLPVTARTAPDTGAHLTWAAVFNASAEPTFATYFDGMLPRELVGGAFHQGKWKLITRTSDALTVLTGE